MAQGGIHPPRAHTYTLITYRHNVFAFVSVFFFFPFLSGWMCPQVRVIFPLAQIRAELKSEAKVTALPPEILRQTPPPVYCAEVKEHANSAHIHHHCCASFVKLPLFWFSPMFSVKTPEVLEHSGTRCLFLLSSFLFVQNCDGQDELCFI